MINEERYTITLSRLEICDLMLACTSIKHSAIDEMKNDPDCSEYRRNHVLPDTIKKWGNLHDKLNRQLDENDAASLFSQLLDEYNSGKYITRKEFEKEAGLRLGFLLPIG